jgi:hypothetical protein
MYSHFQRSRAGKHERYPVVWVHLDDLDYYWGWVKIRAADYKEYLVFRAMENALRDRSATSELRDVFDSVKKDGLKNPLVAAQVKARLYVIVGCQRLAALRVLGWTELVPCRLSPTIDEFPVLDAHPYKTVKFKKRTWTGLSSIG